MRYSLREAPPEVGPEPAEIVEVPPPEPTPAQARSWEWPTEETANVAESSAARNERLGLESEASEPQRGTPAREKWERLKRGEKVLTPGEQARARREWCCKECVGSQPCGDSCIAINKVCHRPRGCAC